MCAKESETSLEELGWRQGSILLGCDIEGLAEYIHDYKDDDIYIVIPYSCAVVQMDFKKEPNVELFRVRKIEKKNKGLLYGKNPRQLNLEMLDNDQPFYVNGFIHDRFFIDHSLFIGATPNSRFSLPSRECATVKNWFAKRYIRNALPTEFNCRTRPALNRLIDSLKTSQDLNELKGVYITLDPRDQELTDLDDPYDVEVCFLVEESGLDNQNIIDISNQLDAELDNCDGVHVSGVELRSESSILLSEYKEMIRLDDYDFISHRDDHENPVVMQE